MTIGYVLINTEPTKEHQVYNKLLTIKEIAEVHPLFGFYDIIVKIKVDSFDDLGTIILNKIRPLEGIIDTKTLTGHEF